ncbi:hypothetical protein MTO96_041861 [Rhipicephalus appendiculatus]
MAAFTLDGVRQLLQRVVSSGTFTRHLEAVRIISAGDGKCTAEVTVNENLLNNLGTMQGSFSASLVDAISTCALLTLRNVRNVQRRHEHEVTFDDLHMAMRNALAGVGTQ